MTPTNHPSVEQGLEKFAYECQYYVIILVKKEFGFACMSTFSKMTLTDCRHTGIFD